MSLGQINSIRYLGEVAPKEPYYRWKFYREVSAKRARKLKKKGYSKRFLKITETGKARYIVADTNYYSISWPSV